MAYSGLKVAYSVPEKGPESGGESRNQPPPARVHALCSAVVR